MADLRGQELRDSYDVVVTRGTGNKLENGNGVEFADLDDKASLSDVKNEFFEEVTLDLSTDDNFTAGELEIEKIGTFVMCHLTVTAEHSSDSQVSTAIGFIPEKFQPKTLARTVFNIGNETFEFGVSADGSISFSYRDNSFTLTNRTNSSSGATLTWKVN